MNLYNTLTRTVQEFKPNNEVIGVYTCGPTVYEKSHIGHWYTYVRNDILVRLLRHDFGKVKWIVNITDVGHLTSDADEGEDKLQKSAESKNKTAWEIAEYYTKDFLHGLAKLNITKPDIMPRATDHINEQIDLIKKLEEGGFTYKIDDGIYFDTSKFPKYQDFAQLDTDEQIAGIRVDFNKNKKNNSDFALWKFSPKNSKRDMEWDSPWGTGFPGWHIECSAMSIKYLGDNFDIHSGGIDHIPVHHTNEIAQSMSLTGKIPANYWFHSNHVMIDNQKISKSLGNGYTIEQLEDLGYKPETIRLHILESSYRNQANFKLDGLEATSNRLRSWLQAAALKWQLSDNSSSDGVFDKYRENILNDLRDDLNTPKALSDIDASFNYVLSTTENVSKREFNEYLEFIDQMLGTKLSIIDNLSDTDYRLIQDRERFKQDKNWAKSDEIRSKLMANGVGLNDTKNATYWFYL